MQDIINISVGSKIAETKSTKDTKTSSDKDAKSSKDFFSIMFSQIKNASKTTETNTKLSTEALEKNILKKEEVTSLSENTPAKSLDDHLLSEVLEVISLLKNETPKTSFPKYSTKIEQLLSDETAIKEFKEVKNIADLMKLSQKYDLGLEKISVKSVDMQTIKEEFPLLEKKGFFEVPKESEKEVKNTFLDTKKTEIKSSEIPLTAIEKPVKQTEKEPTIFEKIIIKDNSKQKVTTEEKIEIKNVVAEKKETQTQQQTLINEKVEVKKTTNEVKISENIKEIPKEAIVSKENVAVKIAENTKEMPKEKVIAKKEEKIEIKKEETEEVVLKENSSTRMSETKIETATTKRGFTEALLQGLKIEREEVQTKVVQPSLQTNTQEKQNNNETTQSDVSEIKTENITTKQEIKITTKQEVPTKQTGVTRETFSSFADDLREKIENYKPPIMKVQMALNPKALGEVDVTIVTRGNNLHVNITSNTNTMSLFTQNQAEFKNSLVNMGFTNLEMNFTDNKGSNQDQQKNSKSSHQEWDEGIEEVEELTNNIELIVPQYV